MIEPRKLKGYQNTTAEANGNGVVVGHDGDIFNIYDFEKFITYITVERVARSLARTTRYVGNAQIRTAQHCVRGADALILLGHPHMAYDFLFHDSAEVLLGDYLAPIKKIIKPLIGPIEIKIEEILAKKFGFQYPFMPIVDLIDKNLAQDEMVMMKHAYAFDYWDEEKSYQQFMETYKKLIDYTDIYDVRQII